MNIAVLICAIIYWIICMFLTYVDVKYEGFRWYRLVFMLLFSPIVFVWEWIKYETGDFFGHM